MQRSLSLALISRLPFSMEYAHKTISWRCQNGMVLSYAICQPIKQCFLIKIQLIKNTNWLLHMGCTLSFVHFSSHSRLSSIKRSSCVYCSIGQHDHNEPSHPQICLFQWFLDWRQGNGVMDMFFFLYCSIQIPTAKLSSTCNLIQLTWIINTPTIISDNLTNT
jgi:hypothetical protein